MKEFFEKNKVFLIGLASAIVVVIQQFIGNGPVDLKALGLGVLIAILSYVANQWRGQTSTILALIGAAAAAVVVPLQTGQPISWVQVILTVVLGYLGLVAPPPKSAGYEKTEVIEEAKAEGKEIIKTERAAK